MTSSWMLIAGALFATMGALAKFLSPPFTGAELSLARSLISLVVIGGVVWWKRHSLRTPHWKGHLWRGTTGTISLIAYFYAMTQLPLATAISLNYTSPLWLALLSTLLLREKFRPRLVVALLVGFVGAILLLRPTFEGSNAVAGVLGLGSGFFAACAYFNVKKLGAVGEPEWRVVFYFGVAGTLGSALVQGVTVGDFHRVQTQQWLPLLAMGLAATLAQLAMTRAYHSGSTLVVGAFAYSTVIFSALFGIVFFDEFLPPIAWLGMSLIIVSGLLAKMADPGASDTKQPALPAEED